MEFAISFHRNSSDELGLMKEFSLSFATATRPLLRQIENLQSTFNAQSSSWEQVERNLTERLSDAQTQLAATTEKERGAQEGAHFEASSKVAALEVTACHAAAGEVSSVGHAGGGEGAC